VVYEKFILKCPHFADIVSFYIQVADYLASVLLYKPGVVSYGITFIETIARSALGIYILFVIPEAHVLSAYVMTGVALFPVYCLAAGNAAAIAVFVGITQPDELAEYAVKFRF
jgi:hypothetical protein